ncbi:hypothetical protein [Vibrio paucivorans]|uniref:Uncharacterized protein n=1 Tax=Vibrio paucivorans TaxID=2829489 RepID=A0A9X3CGD1_9VIBR|nr:hypothetical protein [Vibrio paucivorans]MCW8335313.1 hypothetical protein [Vibrio paucivorans]
MGNSEKRKKRAKSKAKAVRVQKNTFNFQSGHTSFREEPMEIDDDLLSFFRTLPLAKQDYKAVPALKRFVEQQGDTPDGEVSDHVKELFALFIHWCDNTPMYPFSVMTLAMDLELDPDFHAALVNQ